VPVFGRRGEAGGWLGFFGIRQAFGVTLLMVIGTICRRLRPQKGPKFGENLFTFQQVLDLQRFIGNLLSLLFREIGRLYW
jgi:hypothetical protein